MELPKEVLVHNSILGLKGGKAILIRVAEQGYYEVNLTFGEREHRAYLPIEGTVMISRSPEEERTDVAEIER